MTSEEKFASKLCGITPGEVTGLLAKLMRPEFHTYTSRSGGKSVRRWKGELLGIDVEITEVDTTGIVGRTFEDRVSPVDYHVENIEWEFRVTIGSASSYVRDNVAHGKAKLGKHQVIVSYPWFEGDEDTYRSNMSLIRLMGLNNDDEEVREFML